MALTGIGSPEQLRDPNYTPPLAKAISLTPTPEAEGGEACSNAQE